MAMGPRDFLAPHYRETAGLVYAGITPTMLLSTLYGNVEAIGRGRQPYGYWGSRAHRVLSASGPQPNHLTHGIGTAFAAKYLGVDEVSWSTFGDGGASRGEFHEGLNFAAIHELPVVFVCHTNGYTQSVPLALQSATPDIAGHAAGYGIPGVEVDGMDVFAVYEAARQARARAANGHGPTLIEAKTYRYFANTSNDDDRRYRSREEVDEARERDPIDRFAALLAGTACWTATRAWRSTPSWTTRCGKRRPRRTLPRSPTPTRRSGPSMRRKSCRGHDFDRCLDLHGHLCRGRARRASPGDVRGRPGGPARRRRRQPRWRLPRLGRAQTGVRCTPRDRHSDGRALDRRREHRDGPARHATGRRDPVRRLHLGGRRPDLQRGRQVPLPHERPMVGAPRDPHALGRRHPRRVVPLAIDRGSAVPLPGAEGCRRVDCRRCSRASAVGDRRPEPRDCPRAQARVPASERDAR